MPAPLKTEAIVLRSIRYGEADRILHLYTPAPRADRRDRQGRPPGPQPLRGPARAVLPRPLGAPRGPRRPVHRHQRRHGRRARGAARPRRHARRRGARAATRWRGCSRPPPRTPRCSRCWPTSSRCCRRRRRSRRPANGLAFRMKLLLAAGILPSSGRAQCAASPSTCRASRPRPGASCAAPARRPRSRSTRRPTGSWWRRWASRWRRPPDGVGALAAPGRAGDRRDRRAPRQRAAAAAADGRRRGDRTRRAALSESTS